MAVFLVTGATGYIGSRLVPRLLDDGHQVRVISRDRSKVEARAWADRVEIVEGDLADRDDLRAACQDVDVAFYLVHSMDGRAGFAERDRALARAFGAATRDAGVGRIVYLSGLHPDEPLSEHLRSRVEVGETLMASGTPTAVLQAAIIVGAGSASFEMLRHLTERLPAMVAPKWLNNRIQPIAVADVIDLLIGAAFLPSEVNRTFDIGGPDVLTYRAMIERYARLAGLSPRIVVTVPLLTPRLASHWIGLVTPVPTGLAKPLVGSLVHEVICREADLFDLLDRQGPDSTGPDRTHRDTIGFDDAVRAALEGGREAGLARPEPDVRNPAELTSADPDWAGPR